MIRPIWTYALPVWGTCSRSQFRRVAQQQNATLQRHILQAPPFVRNETIYQDFNLDPPDTILEKHISNFVFTNQDHPNELVNEGFEPPAFRRLTRPRHIQDFLQEV